MDLTLETEPIAESIAAQIEAGQTTPATVRELIETVPNARRIIVAAAFRCLGARKWYFEKGSSEKKFEADYRTQLDAVKFLAAYSDGLPTQTSLSVNVTAGDTVEADLERAVSASPALKSRLQKLIGPA
jgi:hypothetical protein